MAIEKIIRRFVHYMMPIERYLSTHVPCILQANTEFGISLRSLISTEEIARIESSFMTMVSENLAAIMQALNDKELYYPLIEECYNTIFYNVRTFVKKCPSPIRCEIPRIQGVHCVNARLIYGHTRLEPLLYIHYPIRSIFIESFDGCYI